MEKTVRVFVVGVAALALTLAFITKAIAAEDVAAPAAEEAKVYTLTLQNHVFEPQQIKVKAGEKFVIHLMNKDNAAEEFESHDLKREKVVAANGEIKLPLGPLKAGTYNFVGEFHEETAKGTLVVE